jgi:hypothetical protein
MPNLLTKQTSSHRLMRKSPMHLSNFSMAAALLLFSGVLSAQQSSPTYAQAAAKGDGGISSILRQDDDHTQQALPSQPAHSHTRMFG